MPAQQAGVLGPLDEPDQSPERGESGLSGGGAQRRAHQRCRKEEPEKVRVFECESPESLDAGGDQVAARIIAQRQADEPLHQQAEGPLGESLDETFLGAEQGVNGTGRRVGSDRSRAHADSLDAALGHQALSGSKQLGAGLIVMKRWPSHQVDIIARHHYVTSIRNIVAIWRAATMVSSGNVRQGSVNVTEQTNQPLNARYLNAEVQVFARYGLDPRTRHLELEKPALTVRAVEFGGGEPALTVRAVEFGGGEPALFLHGFGLCTAHWAPVLAQLPSVHGFAIDMPGHGASDGVDSRGVNLRDWFKDMLTSCLDE